MDIITYSKTAKIQKQVDDINVLLNGEDNVCTVELVSGLNHKQTTTAYESGSLYRTFYIQVVKGKKYQITCTRKINQLTATSVRLCFGTNIPANGVYADWLVTKSVDSAVVIFDFDATNDGYLGMSSYYDNNEGIETTTAKQVQIGLKDEVNDLYYSQINDVSLWEAGYYGATTGDYQYFPISNPFCCMKDKISDLVKTVECPSEFKVRVHAWDGGTYKGTWTGSTFSVVQGSSVAYFTSLDMNTLRAGRTTYVMKLVAVNATDPSIEVPLSDTDKIKMYAESGYEIELISNLSTRVDTIEDKITIGSDYCIGTNFLKSGIKITEIGQISGAQAFCVYNGKYYSCYGTNLYRQSESFTLETSATVSIGHGNALMLGSDGKAYASGWDDDTVYVVDLATMAVTDSISLPVSGYTTCAVDDVNEIMYIFSRTDGTSTVDNWTFTVWDYGNDNVLLTKKITNPFAAIQAVDFYNGRILVGWGTGEVAKPSGMAVYDTNGNMLAEYKADAISSNEPEGICFDRASNRILFSTISQKVFKIEPKE